MTGQATAVVVGVDGSASALNAVTWAADECARHRVPLRLVHGCLMPTRGHPEFVATGHAIRRAAERQAREWLAEAEAVARSSAPDVPVETDLVARAAVPLLVEESRHARLVVLGSMGLGGFTGLLVGSTAVALAAHGHCPAVVVRGTPAAEGPVVVGVDGSPASEAAIGFAFEASSVRGAPLSAVMCWMDFLVDSPDTESLLAIDRPDMEEDEQRLLAQRLAGWQEKYPDVQVDRVVLRDRPVRALLRLAEKARLLVVGSRGRGGLAGMMLGSTSQALVYHSPCPTAVVRPL